MDVWSAPWRDVRPLLTEGRKELVGLLSTLAPAQWEAPTEAGHWRVGDVARHLLDDDLGLLSRWRDGDTAGLIPIDGEHEAFVRALDAKNDRWVSATRGLSRSVVAELLAWTGAAVDAFLATVDLGAVRHVGWAGGETPAWLDIAREQTERWVHGRHIADAIALDPGPPAATDPVLGEVLRTFVWGFPAQVGPAPDGTVVGLTLGDDRWALRRTGGAWSLEPGPPDDASATLAAAAEPAWRHLSGLAVPAGSVRTTGEPELVARLLAVRSILV